MNQDNNIRTWSFDINVAGLTAPTGGRALPEGYYKGKVTDMYLRPEDAGRVQVRVTVAEGEFSGVVRTNGINIPKTPEDNVRRVWRGLAESCGYAAAQLDQGQLKFTPQVFLGRDCYFFYSPKASEGGRSEYETFIFLPQAEWTKQKAAYVPKTANVSAPARKEVAMPVAAPMMPQPTAPAFGGDSTATLGALSALINS